MSTPPLNHAATDYIERLVAGLAKLGKRPEDVTIFDLAPADQLHVRGLEAIDDLITQAALSAADRVVDLGAGLGGPARLLAHRSGCHVTGYDMNGLSVAAGNRISEWVGLQDQVELVTSDAANTPASAAQFDAGWTVHVGMFVPDKDAFYGEAASIIKPGGKFIVYDPVRTGDGVGAYPMPWAASAERDGSLREVELVGYLEAAGFAIERVIKKKEVCIEWLEARREAAKKMGGMPPLGIHLLGGSSGGKIVKSVYTNLRAQLLDFVEIYAIKR